jgi:hypothetical protein
LTLSRKITRASSSRWSDGAGADVRIEQTGVKHEDLNERGKAELAGLENKGAFVPVAEQLRLRAGILTSGLRFGLHD